MESFCPDDAESDESFEFFVSNIDFELPKVRFSFDVSPPPPPPINLGVYDELVSMDPHGFQMVRSRLEDIFPRLSDVATSSIGATVGSYIADFDVTAAQITKAYLSSYGMARDGLGARVIESKHTGRWRPGRLRTTQPNASTYRATQIPQNDVSFLCCSQQRARSCGTSSTTVTRQQQARRPQRATHSRATHITTMRLSNHHLTTVICSCMPC